jgi:hypothetical protein
MSELYSIVLIFYIFFIHSSVDWLLGWFYDLAIVNNATLNMGMQVLLLYAAFDSLSAHPGIV